jgi:hypothetical protein
MKTTWIFCLLVILALSLFVTGCGPSDGDVLSAFKRQAPSWGISFDPKGNLNATELRRVRVDGKTQSDVWRINYDVPLSNGQKMWRTAHVVYRNGRLDLIRTDNEGVVDSSGQIQSLNIDPLKYNRK